MSATNFLRKIQENGRMYIFPSGLNDTNHRKVRFSKFVLLDIPPIKRPTTTENVLQLDTIPGAYHTVSGTDWNSMLTESLQNYVMNLETMILNSGNYNSNIPRTISERVFFKWLKELGGLRFREATPTETSSLAVGKRYVEEDASSIYSRLIQYIGDIGITNSVNLAGDAYTELYIHIPQKDGNSPLVMFKSISDDNYKPNLFFQNAPTNTENNEFIYGRTTSSLHPEGLNISAFFDSDIDAYSSGSLYDLFKKNSEGSYESGWWFPSPLENSYFTESTTFEDYRNDELKIVGTDGNKEIEVEFLRSRLDGITIDLDLLNYRPAQTLSTTAWHEFNSNGESGSFEFNCILLYYDLLDDSSTNVLSTNLYGVVFTNNVTTTTDGGGFIEAHKKYKPSNITGRNGNSYGFKINIGNNATSSDVILVNTIGDNNTFSMQLFVDALNEVKTAASILLSNKEDLSVLSEKIQLLESLVYSMDNNSEILDRLAALETALSESNILIQTSSDIMAIISQYTQEVIDLANNKSTLRVAWNFDGVRPGNGIKIDKSIPNIIRISNNRETYTISDFPIVSLTDDFYRDSGRWYYTMKLLTGTNYLKIQDETDIILDRNLLLFIDDSVVNWSNGQTTKIVFGSKYLLGEYKIIVYSDALGIRNSGTAYKQITELSNSSFATTSSLALEIICIDTDLYLFDINKYPIVT